MFQYAVEQRSVCEPQQQAGTEAEPLVQVRVIDAPAPEGERCPSVLVERWGNTVGASYDREIIVIGRRIPYQRRSRWHVNVIVAMQGNGLTVWSSPAIAPS
jgi:hypothetical protein